MKQVVLFGSPNRSGQTMYVVQKFLQRLGGEYVLYNPYTMNFKPCNDCEYCHTRLGCCLQDDVQQMYRDLADCPRVIVASPMHFGMMTGPLLSLLSRLQFVFSNRARLGAPDPFSPKQGLFIMTAAQRWINMFSPCIDTMTLVFDHLNAVQREHFFVEKTDTIPAERQSDLDMRIDRLCRCLEAQG
jgi:multimeric flavodoxin WrbA